MSLRNDFTDDEWNSLIAAPAMAGIAIAAASPSGPYGLMKEILSVNKAIQDLIENGSDNALINALIDDIKLGRTQPIGPDSLTASSAENATKIALAHLRKLSEMLYRKQMADAVIEGYKRWLVTIAERVAEAAKEGGFLGIGGVVVSDDERAMIRQVTFALGLPTAPR